jgi:benzoate-CoA ligase
LGVPATFNVATYFVDRHVQEGRGDHVAIECGDERITYQAMFERVNRFGSALRDRLGVRPEERVMLLLLDGPAFVYSFFGAIKIGAVPIPTNTLWKEADYRYVLTDSRAVALVVSEALLPRLGGIDRRQLPRLEHIIIVGDGRETEADPLALGFDDLLSKGSPDLEAEPTSRDDAAFWLYSSGSTGAPKGCVHLHHDMVICAELFGKGVLGIRPADRCYSVAKLFFAYGLGNALIFPFAVGATSVLWPGAPAAENVYRVIEAYQPTIFYSVPTGYGMLLAHHRESGEFDLSGVRLAVSAGEALPPALFERFKARFGLEILDGIGSTEALHMFIANRPEALRVGSSGRIVPGYAARLLDDQQQAVATGEIGHLWIQGDSVCERYWNQHGKTRDTIVGHWLRTGDKYTQDADGFYWYAGRADDMMKVGGMWVSPTDVENALLGHPDVQECAVVAHEDRDTLVKPLAFVVLRTGLSGTPERGTELAQFVREQLADYKRPRWIRFVDELPKTATGKIQRFKLRQLARR